MAVPDAAPPRPGARGLSARTPGRVHLGAAVALAGLLAAVYWRPLVLPEVLAPSDAIFATPLFASVAPPDFTRPSNPLLFDQTYQFIPWRHFAWQSVRAGELPLWNPASLAGTPLAATMGAAVFYPLNLALAALPFPRTLVWSAVVRLWLAGFGTYLLATTYGLATAAALVSAVAFTFSGYLTVWLGHPHTNVAVLLPWLLWLDERLLAAVAAGARRRAAALLALVVGVQFTGGHAESSLHVLLCLGAYHVLRWWQRGRGPGLVVAPAGALLLGAALGAPQLLPFLEWLPLSAELARRADAGFRLVDPACLHALATLPLLVFPNLYYNPTWPPPYHSLLPGGNYNEDALWVAVPALALALVGVACRWRAAPVRAWTWLALLAAALAFRLPVVGWLDLLPGLALANPARLRLVVTLGLALLAGFGVEPLAREARARRVWSWTLVVVVAAGAALALVGAALLPAVEPRLVAAAEAAARAKYATLAAPAHPLDFHLAEARRMAANVVAAFRPTHLAMYAPALWAAAALVVTAVRRRRVLVPLLVLVVFADGATTGGGYNPTVPARDFYPAPRLRIDPAPGRVTALGEAFVPDAQLMLGFMDVRGLDFRTRWYDDYLRLVPGRVPWIAYGVLLADVDSPLLRVLNLAAVVAEGPTAPAGTTLVAEDGHAALGALAPIVPRAFLVHEATVAAGDADAARLLAADPPAVFRRVVLDDPDAPPLATPAAPGAEQVALARYAARHAAWEVTSAAPAYLVVMDAYYPGWRATVDGIGVPLRRANLAFRAVAVPAGTHTVAFDYAPRSVAVGLALAAAAAAAIVVLLVFSARRRASA